MPSRRSSNDLVLFNSQDPTALVNWLCDTHGLSAILQAVAQYQTSGSAAETPAKRDYKKRGSKKGAAKNGTGRRGRSKGSPSKPKAEAANG